MTEEDKILYNSALRVYSAIMKSGGNSIEEIKECIEILEEFEDYEKCKDLLEIFNAYKFKKEE